MAPRIPPGFIQDLMARTGKTYDEIAEYASKFLGRNTDVVPEEAIATKLDDLQAKTNQAPFINTKVNEYNPTAQDHLVSNPSSLDYSQGLSYDEVPGMGSKQYSLAPNQAPVTQFDEFSVPKGSEDIKAPYLPGLKTSEVKMDKGIGPMGKLAIGAGGLAVASTLLPEDQPEVQIPSAPGQAPSQQAPKSVIPDNYMDLANQNTIDETAESEAQVQDAKLKASPISKQLEELQPAPPAPVDFNSLMAQAQQASNENTLMANLIRASSQIGAGIAGRGVKPDYTNIEALEKTAGQPVQNVKTQMETDISQKKIKQLKNDMEDAEKLRDPNSDISVTTRELARKLGIRASDATSAKQLQDAGLPLGTLLSTKMAGDYRKETAQLQREAMESNKSEQKLVRHIDTYNKSLQKGYETLSKMQGNSEAMSTIINNAENEVEPGAADVALLYNFIKNMDPDSVVRESEIGLSQNAMSLIGKLKQKGAQLVGGDLLDQKTRDSFREIMKAYQVAELNKFKQAKVNAVNSGKEKGLDTEVLNRALYGDMDVTDLLNKKQEASPEEKNSLTTQNKPKKIVEQNGNLFDMSTNPPTYIGPANK